MGIPLLAGAVMKIAGPVIVAKLADKIGRKEADTVAVQAVQEIVAKVTADPVIRNEVSAEPWWQSRVALGSIVAALGVVLPPALRLLGVDLSETEFLRYADAIVTLSGALYALYGRLASGLKPLFTRR